METAANQSNDWRRKEEEEIELNWTKMFIIHTPEEIYCMKSNLTKFSDVLLFV